MKHKMKDAVLQKDSSQKVSPNKIALKLANPVPPSQFNN